MKELSIEEKAKRYDEAIVYAKKLLKIIGNATLGNLVLKNEFENMFPQLKESEDERIKKEITELVMQPTWKTEKEFHRRKELCAWLEKQGEQKQDVNIQINPSEYINDMGGNGCYLKNTTQKSADNVEPKFKVGDWVAYNHNPNLPPRKIIQITNEHYVFNNSSFDIKTLEEDWHLWTIQDAKKGDVLVNDTILIIVDHLGTFENRPIIYSWYFADSKKFYGMGTSEPDRWGVKGFIPATREQRDLLFKKMRETGYEWDAEKKELKKIEQKPAWSEETNNKINSIKYLLHELGNHNFDNWLESLKDRVLPKQEWSEEDENLFRCAIDAIKQESKVRTDGCLDEEVGGMVIDWLKSLKERYTWKPSDEQMKALVESLSLAKNCGEECAFDLRTLYEQLKKLREDCYE